MRILLDENLDWRLMRELPGHEVDSVPKIGWAGISNGNLLEKAQHTYDVMITMDRGIPYQQQIAKFDLALIGLRAKSNRLADTQPLMPKVIALLSSVLPGHFYPVE
ncbi:MAG: hypothetical protein ACI8UO_004518 [Verrucomicrobiales bacterium]|jgi:hypothetical protein